jgi:uncharacterized protein (DUF1778 family)
MSTRNAPTASTERLEVLIPGDLVALMLRAAALQGQSLMDFVVASASETACRVIRESEALHLSERDQVAFAQALLDPPEPAERMKAAARRFLDQSR